VIEDSASYRIECVDRPNSPSEHRRHLTGIGTVGPNGTKKHWDDIALVRAAMASGAHFFTKSHTSDRTADVEPYDCDCGAMTIRSNPAHVAENNLDNMIPCSEKRPASR
jgi:hypothetical protein